jgi:hypothetical protein
MILWILFYARAIEAFADFEIRIAMLVEIDVFGQRRPRLAIGRAPVPFALRFRFEWRQVELAANVVAAGDRIITGETVDDKPIRRVLIELHGE